MLLMLKYSLYAFFYYHVFVFVSVHCKGQSVYRQKKKNHKFVFTAILCQHLTADCWLHLFFFLSFLPLLTPSLSFTPSFSLPSFHPLRLSVSPSLPSSNTLLVLACGHVPYIVISRRGERGGHSETSPLCSQLVFGRDLAFAAQPRQVWIWIDNEDKTWEEVRT